MLDHVVKQQVEIAQSTEEWPGMFYLPHHVVKKERHGKIKCRIVIDESSSQGNSPSLNDVLEIGPNLLPEVLATLLRFLERPVAIIGDIQQAFLQMFLEEADRDLTRFLWYKILKMIRATTTQRMRWQLTGSLVFPLT